MSLYTVKGKVKAIGSDVLVTDMYMGEMKTKSGIIIGSDNGKNHGVKPRWCRVFAVGSDQKDFKVGEWILVEHGRWSRKFKVDQGNEEIVELQKIDPDCVLGVWDGEGEPDTNYIGEEYNDGQGYDVDPGLFVDR